MGFWVVCRWNQDPRSETRFVGLAVLRSWWLWKTQQGIQIHFLYHSGSIHLQSFRDYTKIHGGQSDLYFMGGTKHCLYSTLLHISSRQKRPEQSRGKTDIWAVRQRPRTLRKRLVKSCWSDPNQEMEKESLRIQIILSTKSRKETAKSMCLKRRSVVVSLISSLTPDRTSESRVVFWVFFLLYAFVYFLL